MITKPNLTQYDLKVLENIHIRDQVSNDFKTLKHNHGYTLFHLTVTWIKSRAEENPWSLNRDLNTLYRHHFVKYATGVKRISRNNRHIQPIFVSFLEEGTDANKSNHGNCKKLHHHCLIAAKHETAQRLFEMCGTNRVQEMCRRHDELQKSSNSFGFKIYKAICSTDLKEITNDEIQTKYPSKSLYKFDEAYILKFNYPFDFLQSSSSMSE